MITYTKMRDGSWGVRGRGLKAGATVTVAKKSGETKSETVGRVVWTGDDGTCLATIVASVAPPGRSARQDGVYSERREDCRRYGWDGVHGSSSYYTSGQYDEDS